MAYRMIPKFESAALTIELRGHYKDRKKFISTVAHLRGHGRGRQELHHFPFSILHLSLTGPRASPPRAGASGIDAIPRCWAHRCPGGTGCLQGVPFFVLAPHMTRSTASAFGSGFRVITASSADTAGVEAPAPDRPSGDCPLGPGLSVLFNAKTARVAQNSSPATDLK